MVTENERRYWKKVLYGDLRNRENKRRYERDMAKMAAMERKGGRKTFLGCGCFVWTLILIVIAFFILLFQAGKKARELSPQPLHQIETEAQTPFLAADGDLEADSVPEIETESEPKIETEPETKPEVNEETEPTPEAKPKKKNPKRETVEHGTIELKKPKNEKPRYWTDINGNQLYGTLNRMTAKGEVYLNTKKGTKKFKMSKFSEPDRDYILDKCLDYPDELEDAMKEREK